MGRDEEPEGALDDLFGELRSLLQGDLIQLHFEDVWPIVSAASAIGHARCLDAFVPYLIAHARMFDGALFCWSEASIVDANAQLRARVELIPFLRAQIEVNGDDLADAALETLAAEPAAAHLRDLLLIDCAVTGRGAQALARSAHLSGLEALNLGGCDLDADALAALLGSASLTALRHLDLRSNDLASSQWRVWHGPRPALESLVLRTNRLDGAHAEVLARSPGLAGLKMLDLSYNAIGDVGACALARSEHIASLRALHLDGNGITSRGWSALSESPRLDGALRAMCLKLSR